MAAETHTPNRRKILATLAAVPVAGLPAVAGVPAVAEDDPIFAALADLERINARVEAIGAKHTIAESAMFEARPDRLFVELEGRQFHSLELLDCWFESALTRADILKLARNFREQSARRAEREATYRAARAELSRIAEAVARADDRSGFAEADAEWTAVLDEQDGRRLAAFETTPTTPAGAAALIRFAADMLDEIGINDTVLEDVFTGAIRNAVAVLEREARA